MSQEKLTYDLLLNSGQRKHNNLVVAAEFEDVLDSQAFVLRNHEMLYVLAQDALSLTKG